MRLGLVIPSLSSGFLPIGALLANCSARTLSTRGERGQLLCLFGSARVMAPIGEQMAQRLSRLFGSFMQAGQIKMRVMQMRI